MQNSTIRCIVIACMICSGSISYAQSDLQKQTQSGRVPVSHEGLQAALWMQTSAEYRILCKIMFNQAKQALDAALGNKDWTACLEQTNNYSQLPPAVIVDIDETVLDNSPFQGEVVKRDTGFDPQLWTEWAKLEQCKGIPGALQFVQYAQSRDVTLFFVTNRDHSVEVATRNNLIQLGVKIPESVDTILTKKEKKAWSSSDKSLRRSEVAATYRILLLIGDDLGDFVSAADYSPTQRIEVAEKNADKWGKKWFLLPNPFYGSWDGSVYNYEYGLKRPAILKIKRERIRGFK